MGNERTGTGNFLCPKCQGTTTVKDSRPVEEGSIVRRRRHCIECSHRFTTYELATDGLSVRIAQNPIGEAKKALLAAAETLAQVAQELKVIEAADNLMRRDS